MTDFPDGAASVSPSRARHRFELQRPAVSWSMTRQPSQVWSSLPSGWAKAKARTSSASAAVARVSRSAMVLEQLPVEIDVALRHASQRVLALDEPAGLAAEPRPALRVGR